MDKHKVASCASHAIIGSNLCVSINLMNRAPIQQLYDDCYIGGFVPPALLSSSSSVKLFVLFLYRELYGQARAAMGRSSASWFSTLREAMSAEGGVSATG